MLLLTNATNNLGIRLNLKLVLYLEDLTNPNNGLNFNPKLLVARERCVPFKKNANVKIYCFYNTIYSHFM
jgi:hypothetical protein